MASSMDVDKVMLVLSDFKAEALADESTAEEIRCKLKSMSAASGEAKVAVSTQMETARQECEAAEVALQNTKDAERRAVSELESKVNTLVDVQVELQSVQEERKKVQLEGRDELVMGDELREAKHKNMCITESLSNLLQAWFCLRSKFLCLALLRRAFLKGIIFLCFFSNLGFLSKSRQGSSDQTDGKISSLKNYLQEIGTEKSLVCAADGLKTQPEVRGDFDKIAIDCIKEELSEKLKEAHDETPGLEVFFLTNGTLIFFFVSLRHRSTND